MVLVQRGLQVLKLGPVVMVVEHGLTQQVLLVVPVIQPVQKLTSVEVVRVSLLEWEEQLQTGLEQADIYTREALVELGIQLLVLEVVVVVGLVGLLVQGEKELMHQQLVDGRVVVEVETVVDMQDQ